MNPLDPHSPGVGPSVAESARPADLADAVAAAYAIGTVTAALIRYAAETAVRRPRRFLPRLAVAPARVVRSALRGPLGRALAHPASTAVQAVAAAADELVPDIARAVLARLDVPGLVREYVDVDRVAALLDVDAVVARVDFDAVLDRVDMDAIAARLDVDAVAARLDVDAVAARIDLNTIADKIDVSRVIDRVDLDAVVARVDLDGAVDRVDLDAIVAKVDLDRAVDRVDVDRVIARTDVAGLARYVVQEIDLAGLLRASTGSVTSEMVRGVRDQGADADRAVERVVDRLLRRQGRRAGLPTQRGPESTGDGT